MYTGLY